MGNTLNVSLPESQLNWIRERKERGEYKTMADVIQELVRRAQEEEAETIRLQFERLNRYGADGAPPIDRIVATSRMVKRERHASRRS